MEERSEREEKDGEEEDDDNDELAVQFKNLQQYWDSLQSNPRRIPRSCSSGTKCPVGKSLYLLKNSPTKPMSSLQRRRTSSPLGGVWKVRTNDLAVEEILRERRAAIESGKVKGRRLFWGMEGATEMDLGYQDWSDLVQDSGIRSASSLSPGSPGSSGSADGDERDNGGSNCWGCSRSGDDMERNKMVGVETNVEGKRGDNGRRWRVFMGWVGIALVIFTLLMSFEGDGDEVFLVPT